TGGLLVEQPTPIGVASEGGRCRSLPPIFPLETTMLLKFLASPNPQKLRCRRGTYIYREREVDPEISEIEYLPLETCRIELLENDTVVGTLYVGSNVPKAGVLNVVAPKNVRNVGHRTKKV